MEFRRSARRWGLATVLLAGAMAALAQAPSGPPPKEAFLKADLFIGIRDDDPEAVRRALDAGADVNGRNWLEVTPLQFAATRGKPAVIAILLARGARVKDGGVYGGAVQFAAQARYEATALDLLQRGGEAESARVDRATSLMVAAANGHLRLMDALLKRGAKVDARDVVGGTPLIWAARQGQAASVARLIAAGASVGIADKAGRTAVHHAAMNGHDAALAALLRAGAKADLPDAGKATPLTLAARYNGDPAILTRLLDAGADARHRDGRGRTAGDLLRARGYSRGLKVLMARGGSAAKLPPTGERVAVERSLGAIQKGMKTFVGRAACMSCHHQGLGMMAVGAGLRSGFRVDMDLVATYGRQAEETGKSMGPLVHAALETPDLRKLADAVDIDDFNIGSGYLFAAPAVGGAPANPGLAEVAALLGTFQRPQGHFTFGLNREPMQISESMTTALAMVVIRTYGDKAALAPVVARARRWFATHPGVTAEERAARVLGMAAVGESGDGLASAVAGLRSLQRPDGGWAAKPGLRSDAYATGLACYALQLAGRAPSGDPSVRRGLDYLLRTQDEDGSWFVVKRAAAWNNYFDAGFPHAESQYTSFAATCWSALALLESVKPSGLLAAR